MNRAGRAGLALVASVALVVGASFVRTNWLEGDRGSGGGGAGGSRLRVVCAAELGAVCERFARAAGDDVTITVEPALATTDRLAGEDRPEDVDAWITLDPMPGLVDERRRVAGREPLLATDAVAATTLQWAVSTRVNSVLTKRCGGRITWACLAENAGAPWSGIGGDETWGQVRVGHDDPGRDARGVLVIGQFAAHLLGPRVPVDQLSRDDFDDPAFRTAFGRLERAVPSDFFAGTTDQSAFEYVVGTNFAGADVVATTRAEATSAPSDGYTLVTPEPTGRAGVVVAGIDGGGDDLLEGFGDRLRQALEASGWSAGSTGTTGLPSAGVLDALVGVWKETVG